MIFSGRSRIISCGVFHPGSFVKAEDLVAGCDLAGQIPLGRLTGIETVRHAPAGTVALDLARSAALQCLANAGIPATKIDVLIAANICRAEGEHRLVWEPSSSIQLREDLGCDHAFVLDISNACAGMWTAMMMGDVMLAANSCQYCLVVSGEFISHLAAVAQREVTGLDDPRVACLTLGDAGAAVLMQRFEPHPMNLTGELYTLGYLHRACVAMPTSHPHGGMIMHSDPVSLAAGVLEQAPEHALFCANKFGWDRPFDWIIPHQTSRSTIMNALRRTNQLLGYRGEGQPIMCLQTYGNTASTSHFVALTNAITEGKVEDHQRILFSISGSGITVGTAACNIGNLPSTIRAAGKGSWGQDRSNMQRENATGEKTRGTLNHFAGMALLRMESVGTSKGCDSDDTFKLVKSAATQCLSNSRYDADEIDLIVHVGTYRSQCIIEPAIAAILAGELEINSTAKSASFRKTLAFDAFNGDLAFLCVCRVTQDLLASGQAKRVMVVQSECNVPDFESLGLCSPAVGAAAVIFDRDIEEIEGFCGWSFNYDTGQIAGRRVRSLLDGSTNHYQIDITPGYHELLHQFVDDTLDRLFESSELCATDIGTMVVTPDSMCGDTQLLNRLASKHQSFEVIASPSVPFAFTDLTRRGLTGNKSILFVSVSAGAQVGCAVYRCGRSVGR